MKKHLLKTVLALIILFSFILIINNSVQAQELKLQIPFPGVEQVIEIDGDSLGSYISNLYKFAVGALAIISVIMIMIGGFQWLISAGSSEKVASAKDKIYNSIIGLILALTSFLLLNTINPNLVKFQSLSIDDINPYKIKTALTYLDAAETQCKQLMATKNFTNPYASVSAAPTLPSSLYGRDTCNMACVTNTLLFGSDTPDFAYEYIYEHNFKYLCCMCKDFNPNLSS